MDITIRDEAESDIDAIFVVTEAAFRDHPHGDHTEQFMVNALRYMNALIISLVAGVRGVVGHVALSPVNVSYSSPDRYGLGLISFLP